VKSAVKQLLAQQEERRKGKKCWKNDSGNGDRSEGRGSSRPKSAGAKIKRKLKKFHYSIKIEKLA